MDDRIHLGFMNYTGAVIGWFLKASSFVRFLNEERDCAKWSELGGVNGRGLFVYMNSVDLCDFFKTS